VNGFERISRRSFLQAAGFALASTAGGCSRPTEQVLAPRFAPSEQATPGRRLQYATTCGGCSAGCGVLASVQDGRPLKLEGVPAHPVSRGGLCAAGQASILGLYDSHRIRQPRIAGEVVSWQRIDQALAAAFNETRAGRRAVRLLTGTDAAASPTTRAAIDRFLNGFADARHAVYDVLSSSAIAAAHRLTHGVRAIPHFLFERAALVASFDADFLGTWLSPVEFMAMRSSSRPRLHVQFESRMSLTGTKADRRIVMAPGAAAQVMTALAQRLAHRAGHEIPGEPQLPANFSPQHVDELAEELWRARGRALVVCGSESVAEQALANAMNEFLGAYGATLDLARPSRQRLGDDVRISQLGRELARGEVGVLVIAGVNPVHGLPDGTDWQSMLANVPTLVAVAERLDETAQLARYQCPPPHPLESWGDYEPVAGVLGLRQPTTEVMGDTRSLAASLATWSGDALDAQALVRRHWRERVFNHSVDGDSFDAFWDRSLQAGWITRSSTGAAKASFDASTARAISPKPRAASGGYDLLAYPSVALQDGRQAYNPWLLELPDPVTKITWDSCASLSPATANAIGVVDGDLVRITALSTSEGSMVSPSSEPGIEVPIVVQPGQHDDVIAIPLGYGQLATSRFAGTGPVWRGAPAHDAGDGLVGANAAPLLAPAAAAAVGRSARVQVTATGRSRTLARTQTYPRVAGTDSAASQFGPPGGPVQYVALGEAAGPSPVATGPQRSRRALWSDEHPYSGPRWGMVIDLDACTGCSACVIACQVENNTPVIGRDEVRRNREMHWIRIDRYYFDGPRGTEVAHQPMTCHHCRHAPCETVCPVAATTHSSDGLNQQIYSRCIGTRYCMNNCPFKVRRFNWFDYSHDDRLQNLSLNPDVSVRTRGVAEKCTFCAHRIQDVRLAARQEGREPTDGETVPACAQSCPAAAITFGDLNDPSSGVSRAASDRRTYTLLDDLNLRPAIRYQAIVRRGPTAPGRSGRG